MARLAIARLYFCSNSFNAQRTRMEDMAAQEWRSGLEALELAPEGSELQAVRDVLAMRPDWQPSVLRCASAPPGGPLHAEVFGAWLGDVEAGLRGARFDAVFLSLHGACQAEGDPVADLTILRRVRALVGRTPVVATFDAAANLSDEVPLLLDGASATRSWPGGSGGDAAARRVLGILDGLLAGRVRPVAALARIGSVLPSLAAPHLLPELWEDGIASAAADVLDASVFAGFPWSDSRLTGASALVWTDRDAALARGIAGELAQRFKSAPRGPALWRPEQALAAGLASGGRFALLDPADDPQAGGMADTPGLLAMLIAATPGVAGAFAALHDPDTLAAARVAGAGATLDRSLGATATDSFGPPVALRATVERIVAATPTDADGAGALAVLRCGRLSIVVSERRPLNVTLDLLARAGIDVEAMGLLALKAGAATDFALAACCPEVLACAVPGPACADLLQLPFQYVPVASRTP